MTTRPRPGFPNDLVHGAWIDDATIPLTVHVHVGPSKTKEEGSHCISVLFQMISSCRPHLGTEFGRLSLFSGLDTICDNSRLVSLTEA